MLAVSAVGIVLLIAPLTAGQDLGSSELIFASANGILDLLLLSLVIAFIGLGGGGRGRAWPLLGVGLAVWTGADFSLLREFAAGTYEAGSAIDSLWLAGAAIMALAPWQPPPPRVDRRKAGWRLLALPFTAGSAAIGLLLVAGLNSHQPVAAVFAAAALMTAMVRTTMSIYELRRLGETRRQASTDELTGLPNRRWFDRELRRSIDRAAPRASSWRCS